MCRILSIIAVFCMVLTAIAIPPEFEKEDPKAPPPGVSRFGDTDDYRYKWKVDPTNNSTIRPGTEFFTPKFGHEQKRQGDLTSGRYYVYLGDGRLQIVDYNASKTEGYKAEIRYVDQQERNAETQRQEAARAGNPAASTSAPAAVAVQQFPAVSSLPVVSASSAGAIPNTQGFFETLVPARRISVGAAGGALLSNTAFLARNGGHHASSAVAHPPIYQLHRPMYASATHGRTRAIVYQQPQYHYQRQQPQYYQQPAYQTAYQQQYNSYNTLYGR